MIFVTLVCVVLGRVAFLRSCAEFHEQEAERYAWKVETSPAPHESYLLIYDLHRLRVHRVLATRFRRAAFCPWLIVDESPPPPEKSPVLPGIRPAVSPSPVGVGDPAAHLERK